MPPGQRAEVAGAMVLIVERIADGPIITEPTVTPEDTLREAGVDDARQAEYQRKLSTVLAGRRPAGRLGRTGA